MVRSHGHRYSTEIRQAWVTEYEAGDSITTIANRCGAAYNTVWYMLFRSGVKIRPATFGRKGQRQPRSLESYLARLKRALPDLDPYKALRQYKSGISIAALARNNNTTPRRIQYMIYRLSKQQTTRRQV